MSTHGAPADEKLLRDVAITRWRAVVRAKPLGRLFGVEPRVDDVGARGLLRAASRLSQGRWLAALAVASTERAGDRPIRIAEFGTGTGISGLYLIVGMSRGKGGHLTTFEGNEHLVKLAEHHMRTFIERHRLRGVSFDVRAGRFEDTVPRYFADVKEPLDLVFVDGDHQEGPTLEFHRLARSAIAPRGIIVHDDIAWSAGMERAWRSIKESEGCRVIELLLGGRASRGILWLGEEKGPVTERYDLDTGPERWVRRLVREVGRARMF